MLQANNSPDSRIYVWDIETDSFQSFDFASGHGSGAEEEDKESIDIMSKAQQAAEIAGRRPMLQYWDPTEPKLLVCETSHIPGWKPSNAAKAVDDSKEVICIVFLSRDPSLDINIVWSPYLN